MMQVALEGDTQYNADPAQHPHAKCFTYILDSGLLRDICLGAFTSPKVA